MKGIVFTEFLEMVEDKFGYDTVDDILENSELPSGGVYTAVGTYAHSEMIQLISNLSSITKITVPDLLKSYGQYLFNTFLSSYPGFFERSTSSFDFLESIDNHIHVEVKKLYPDAELPRFETNRINDTTLEMIYTSQRKMSAFAEGLIEKTLEHYGDNISLEKEAIDEEGTQIKFTIVRSKMS